MKSKRAERMGEGSGVGEREERARRKRGGSEEKAS